MRANTNISVKDRLQMTLSDFKGVDFSSCPQNVHPNRASDMVNFINEYGVNRKRNGWKEFIRICDDNGVPQRINGIFLYSGESGKQLIVHAGKRFYIVYPSPKYGSDLSPYQYQDITFPAYGDDADIIPSRIKDQRSQAFQRNGKLYIIGCGDYLVYDGGALCRVENNEDTYIPTTTINIDNDSVTDDTVRDVLDDVNLLSKKRINTLVGTYSEATWTLDASIDEGTLVEVEIETTNGIRLCSNSEPDKMNLYDESGAGVGSIDFNLGKISIRIPTTPPASNDANIKVTFEHAVEGYADRINNCGFGVLFGIDGNTDRLFVSGNSDYPNIDFHSEMDDFTYFSVQSSCAMGSDVSAVKGYSRLSDSTLVIYKEDTGHDATIFYRVGKYLNGHDNNGNINSMKGVFPTSAGSIGEGVVSSYACANLAGDNLMLSKNGVFGVVLSNNVATNERYIRERSRNINARLTKHKDLSEATAIAYQNRYYLAVDGVCYVADARHKSTRSDDIDGSFNYEWWFWDNIPARIWSVLDDHLCFGTTDGMLCYFDDEYTDRTIEVKSITHGLANMLIAYTDEPITENDTISLYNPTGYLDIFYDVTYLYAQGFEVKDGKIYTSAENITKMFAGDEVVVDNVGDSGLHVDVTYYIQNVDKARCCFELSNGLNLISPVNSGFVLHKRIEDGVALYIADINHTAFRVKTSKNGEPIVLTDYNGKGLPGYAIITHRKNVVAKWYTPAFDMGTNISAKTLLRLAISTEPKVNGRLSFGYETRNISGNLNAKGLDTFSFDDLNFEDFAFDTEFATSYTVKVKVRNFNYIIFRFISDNDADCAINNFTIVYKINRTNRGVN